MPGTENRFHDPEAHAPRLRVGLRSTAAMSRLAVILFAVLAVSAAPPSSPDEAARAGVVRHWPVWWAQAGFAAKLSSLAADLRQAR